LDFVACALGFDENAETSMLWQAKSHDFFHNARVERAISQIIAITGRFALSVQRQGQTYQKQNPFRKGCRLEPGSGIGEGKFPRMRGNPPHFSSFA
jgi:hypothetical protein